MLNGSVQRKLPLLLYVLLISFLFSGLNNTAQAANQVGVVVSSEGKVTANSRALSRRSPIYQGDNINTAAASKVSLKFTDGSVVTLSENSSYKINNYAYKSGNAPDVFDANLVKGGLKTKTGVIGKEAQHTQDAKEAGIPENQQVKVANYKVKASVATIGVRGTEYKCLIESDKVLISALDGTVGVDFFDNYVELGDGADASYIEIALDGNYMIDTQDQIDDDDFDVDDDEDSDDDDDEDSDQDSDSDDDSDDEGDDGGDESGDGE